MASKKPSAELLDLLNQAIAGRSRSPFNTCGSTSSGKGSRGTR